MGACVDAAPPLTSLRELQAASLHFEQYLEDEEHPDYARWLTQLIAPGTSLGGARPKASVHDEAGILCLAKFPSRQDTRDIGAWELVAHRIAAAAGFVNFFHSFSLLRDLLITTLCQHYVVFAGFLGFLLKCMQDMLSTVHFFHMAKTV